MELAFIQWAPYGRSRGSAVHIAQSLVSQRIHNRKGAALLSRDMHGSHACCFRPRSGRTIVRMKSLNRFSSFRLHLITVATSTAHGRRQDHTKVTLTFIDRIWRPTCSCESDLVRSFLLRFLCRFTLLQQRQHVLVLVVHRHCGPLAGTSGARQLATREGVRVPQA